MTFFEYAMVMVSIMIAIGLSQLLRALGDVLLSSRRYGPVVGWIAALIFLFLQIWWAYWDMHQGVDWTFAIYGFVLVGPGLLLIASNLLVPVARSDVIDWREHFYDLRRPFFALMICFQVFGIAFTWIVMDVPLLVPFRAIQVTGIAVFLAGLASSSVRVHAVLPLVYLALIVTANALFRALPAAFGVSGG